MRLGVFIAYHQYIGAADVLLIETQVSDDAAGYVNRVAATTQVDLQWVHVLSLFCVLWVGFQAVNHVANTVYHASVALTTGADVDMCH